MAMTRTVQSDKVDKIIASDILQEIKSAKNILLHLHPSPDPDSIGSTLALYHFISSLEKSVTLIGGDSDHKNHHNIFPGINSILNKNFFEINIHEFDLFLILDSSDPSQVSKLGDVASAIRNIKTIVIDHHPTNKQYGDINIVLPDHTSTSEIIFDLFKIWKCKLTTKISICLFLGIYGDTSGFTNLNTTSQSMMKSSVLAKFIPNLSTLIFESQNNSSVEEMEFIKLGLNNNKLFFNNQVAISLISLDDLKKHNLDSRSINKVKLSETLRKCVDWKVCIAMVETEYNSFGLSIRSRNQNYDVSKIALDFSGGGHKVASGGVIKSDRDEALRLLLESIKRNIPQLGRI